MALRWSTCLLGVPPLPLAQVQWAFQDHPPPPQNPAGWWPSGPSDAIWPRIRAWTPGESGDLSGYRDPNPTAKGGSWVGVPKGIGRPSIQPIQVGTSPSQATPTPTPPMHSPSHWLLPGGPQGQVHMKARPTHSHREEPGSAPSWMVPGPLHPDGSALPCQNL